MMLDRDRFAVDCFYTAPVPQSLASRKALIFLVFPTALQSWHALCLIDRT